MTESKLDKILKWATPILLLVLVLQSYGGVSILGGTADNTTRFGSIDLTEDLTIDDNVVIDAGRGLRIASGTVLSGEVTLNTSNCSTATWNPGLVTSSTNQTTTIALPSGYSNTDLFFGSFSATTTAASEAAMLNLNLGLTGATSSQILAQFTVHGTTTVDAATGTLRVCYFD